MPLQQNHLKWLSSILFTVMIFSCTNPQCGIKFSQDEKGYISSGESFQRNGKYDEAIIEYDKAININGSNYVALSNRASCMFEKEGLAMSKQSLSVCLDALEEAIEICPQFRPAYTNLITISSDYQVSNICVHYGKRYNALFEKNCYIEAKVAKAYLEMRDTTNTRKIIEEQQGVSCTNGGLSVTEAKYYQVVRDTLKSHQILSNLIENEPSNYFALIELGELMRNKGNFHAAKSAYKEALLYDHDNFEASWGLSQLYFSQNDSSSGCVFLEKAKIRSDKGLYSILHRDSLLRLSQRFCNL